MFVLILYILTGSKAFQVNQHLTLQEHWKISTKPASLPDLNTGSTHGSRSSHHCKDIWRKIIKKSCACDNKDHLLSNFLTCALVDFVLFSAFASSASSFFSSSIGGGSGDMRRRYSCKFWITCGKTICWLANLGHQHDFLINSHLSFLYLLHIKTLASLCCDSHLCQVTIIKTKSDQC